MKKLIRNILCLLPLIASGTTSSSQVFDYFENNPEWRGSHSFSWTMSEITTFQYSLYLSGDSIIDGNIYHKINKKYERTTNYDDSYFTEDSYHTLLRQEGDKIYQWIDDLDQLAYDFNLTIGDTIHESYYCIPSQNWVVMDLDTLEINGNNHRRFHFNNEYFLIEGIGHLHGIIHPIYQILDGGNDLFCYRQNEEIFFINGESECDFDFIGIDENQLENSTFSIFPNPASQSVNIKIPKRHSETVHLQIFNSTGQLVFKKTNITEELFQLSITDFVSGVYTIVLTSQNQRIDSKLLMID